MPANKVCPFRVSTSPAIDIDIIITDSQDQSYNDTYVCIGSHCQIWDVDADDCSLKNNSLKITEFFELYEHWHNSHEHPRTHVCLDISDTCGLSFQPVNQVRIPLAAQLITEYNMNQDTDGNGKVYGYDFQIADGPDKPRVLLSIENDPTWVPIPTEVTWTEMIDWWENGGPDPLV